MSTLALSRGQATYTIVEVKRLIKHQPTLVGAMAHPITIGQASVARGKAHTEALESVEGGEVARLLMEEMDELPGYTQLVQTYAVFSRTDNDPS